MPKTITAAPTNARICAAISLATPGEKVGWYEVSQLTGAQDRRLVTRGLQSARKALLVEYIGNSWTLTEEGKAEAAAYMLG